MTTGAGSGDTAWIDAAEIIIVGEARPHQHDNLIHSNNNNNSDDDSDNIPNRHTLLPLAPSTSGFVTQQQQQQQVLLSSSSTPNVIVLKLFCPATQLNVDGPFCCVPLNVMTVTRTGDSNESRKYSSVRSVIVRMHPLLYEYLTMQRQLLGATVGMTEKDDTIIGVASAAEANKLSFNALKDNNNQYQPQKTLEPVTIAPLPLAGYHLDSCMDDDDPKSNRSFWYMESTASLSSSYITSTIHDPIVLPHGSTITIQIIYQYDTVRQECCWDSSSSETTNVNGTTDVGANLNRNQQNYLLHMALCGRIIATGAILLLPVMSYGARNSKQSNFTFYYYLVRIHDISINPSVSSRDESPLVTWLYRRDYENCDSNSDCNIVVIYPDIDCDDDDQHTDVSHSKHSSFSNIGVDNGCPGYESLQKEFRQLLQLSMNAPTNAETAVAAPSGILFTGCAGVGKTRFITSIIGKHIGFAPSTPSASSYHYVSAHDLVMLASWAGEVVTMDAIYPPQSECKVLILDDLHILGHNSSIDGNSSIGNGRETRLVLNSIIQVIDRINNSFSSRNASSPPRCVIIGIGRDKSVVPYVLLKTGRLEKEIEMLPPSQSQREVILYHLLLRLKSHTTDDVQAEYESCCQLWAELLATGTSGCVASDLRQMCSDAWCNRLACYEMETNVARKIINSQSTWPVSWLELSEAVRNVIPSQLAMLDVTKPKLCLDCCSIDDWFRIHELSWETFAGYETVKKGIYRSVVIPWRRHFHRRSDSTEADTIIPPSGILFHGPSGCGKTFAARCLGSSLGLPMIKVRASDVMDKWLGGSEATLRSLFTRARGAAPCILFFDEIDAIASNRANSDCVTSDVMSRLLSTLLNEMDGISSTHHSNVIVVACTNRLESLDAALLRPGRLDEHISLMLPCQDDSHAILEQKLAHAPLDASMDLKQVAGSLTDRSASGADIEGICREAILKAIRRCSTDYTPVLVTIDDIESAMEAIKR